MGPATTLLVSALLASGPDPGSRPDALASLESEQAALFSRVAPSVLLIVGEGTSGSGFSVASGLVLTNAHVVGERDEVRVQLFDGRHGRGRVVARATGALDLALVRIPFEDVPPLAAGDPAAVQAGTYTATVGHGGGAAWTLSTGLVANPRPLGDAAPLFLAQMALRPGSSGGPLVDRLGRVVGVVTSGTRDASGVTFAIRIDAAAAAFPQLAAWAESPRPGTAAPAVSVTAEESALVAAGAPPRSVVDVARLSSGEPQPARAMTTVWEASKRPARRTAGRVAVRPAAAPLPDTCEPTLACELPASAHEPAASRPPSSPQPWAFFLAATAAAAAAAGAIAARRVGH